MLGMRILPVLFSIDADKFSICKNGMVSETTKIYSDASRAISAPPPSQNGNER